MSRKNKEKLVRHASAWAIFRRFFPYIRPHRRYLAVIIACLVFASLLNVFTIVAFKPVVEVFFGIEDISYSGTIGVASDSHNTKDHNAKPQKEKKVLEQMAEKYALARWVNGQYEKFKEKKAELNLWFQEQIRKGRKFQVLIILSLVILGANLLRLLCNFWANFLTSYVGLSIIRDLKSVLYRHVLHLDMPFFASRSTGYLMSRITSDVSGVRTAVMLLFSKVLRDPITLVFMLSFLFYLNWKLSLCIFMFVPLTIIPIRFFGKRVRHLTRRERKTVADISSAMAEILGGIKIVKAFRMEEYEYEKFHAQNWQHFNYLLRRRRTKEFASPFMDFLGIMAVVIVLLIGGYFIMRTQTMAASEFVIYLYALSRIYGPIKNLEKANEDLQEGLAHAERIFEMVDTRPTVKEQPDAITLGKVKGEILLDNVTFSYSPEIVVLKNINLHIPAGKTVALVGPSGAGKSTLVSLIPRFYDPEAGSVSIDGIDVKKVTFDSLRNQIGIVSQESILFNDTIRNNISYGRKDIADEKIIESAKLANAHDFIMRLPEKYATRIGERGAKLSGGERQRITIARAILKNPPMLILDEATSNLDSEAEALIQEALARLISNRTTIVIAHRLSTVMIADVIVVLDKGEIVEMGTHQELIERGGLYAKLCQIQFNVDRPPATV